MAKKKQTTVSTKNIIPACFSAALPKGNSSSMVSNEIGYQ